MSFLKNNCQVFEGFYFELWGFDNDYITTTKKDIIKDIESVDIDIDTSEEEKCQCCICYSCRIISKLSDTYIKYKDE
jgi:hypothetical protein